MPERSPFNYAAIRVVPSVERGEFVNAGVIVFCRSRRYLDARIELPRGRLSAIAPWLDPAEIEMHLDCVARICRGGHDAGPIGQLAQAERFHWLVAPRSTVIQPGPVHAGLCLDPEATLNHLLDALVRDPAPPALAAVGPSAEPLPCIPSAETSSSESSR